MFFVVDVPIPVPAGCAVMHPYPYLLCDVFRDVTCCACSPLPLYIEDIRTKGVVLLLPDVHLSVEGYVL